MPDKFIFQEEDYYAPEESFAKNDKDDLEEESYDDPFDEEFDREDVVNSDSEEDLDVAFSDGNQIADEMLGLPEHLESDGYTFKYDEDIYKRKKFNLEYGTVDSKAEEEIRKQQENFKDFLLAPKIAGRIRSATENNVISSRDITDADTFIEIEDEFMPEDSDVHESTQIITNKNKAGDIVNVEVICVCGRRTIIRFDYGEETSQEVTSSETNESIESSNSMLDSYLGDYEIGISANNFDKVHDISKLNIDDFYNLHPNNPEEIDSTADDFNDFNDFNEIIDNNPEEIDSTADDFNETINNNPNESDENDSTLDLGM